MQTLDSSASLSSLDFQAYQAERASVDSDSLEGYELGKELLQTRRHSGVVRNDRTPLNTPYTPHLVKLQLSEHGMYTLQEEQDSISKNYIITIYSKVAGFYRSFGTIRICVATLLIKILPSWITHSFFFEKYHQSMASVITASIFVPLILLTSPIVITLCFLTSPIWMTALLVVGMHSVLVHTKKKMMPNNYTKSSSPVANAVSPHSVTRNGSKLAVGHSLQKMNGHGNGHGISVLKNTKL